MLWVIHDRVTNVADAVYMHQVVARAAEMALRLGWFFGSLALDRASGADDNSDRVRYRAAQLRCAQAPWGPLQASQELSPCRIAVGTGALHGGALAVHACNAATDGTTDGTARQSLRP